VHIRVLDVEATPEDVARTPELRDLLRSFQHAGPAPAPDPPPPPVDPASRDISAFLDLRGPGGVVRRTLDAFLHEVLGWGGVEWRVGVSRANRQDPAKVIRLHRRGSGVGAFVYVHLPSAGLKFRLPRDHPLADLPHARAREVQPNVPYGIALALTAGNLSEAIELAKRAYDEAAPPAGSG
jgi:hypothetical protein